MKAAHGRSGSPESERFRVPAFREPIRLLADSSRRHPYVLIGDEPDAAVLHLLGPVPRLGEAGARRRRRRVDNHRRWGCRGSIRRVRVNIDVDPDRIVIGLRQTWKHCQRRECDEDAGQEYLSSHHLPPCSAHSCGTSRCLTVGLRPLPNPGMPLGRGLRERIMAGHAPYLARRADHLARRAVVAGHLRVDPASLPRQHRACQGEDRARRVLMVSVGSSYSPGGSPTSARGSGRHSLPSKNYRGR